MRGFKIYYTLTWLLTAACITLMLTGAGWQYTACCGVLLAIVLILLHRAVAKPLRAVQSGIYLLAEQDFASRLRTTGQHDADRVVKLFNTLMDTLKAERLKGLEQNNFLSRLIEVSPMGVAICDLDGNIIETNPAWRRMVTGPVLEAVTAVPEGETLTLRPDQTLIMRCSRLWFMDSGYRRPFYLAERLTDEILQAEKQVYNKIIRTMGHEVNNTMGSVISVLDTMADMNADGNELTAETLRSCAASCENLVTFVRRYADLVKLPAPTLHETDPAAWMRSLMPTLAGIVPYNVSLGLEVSAGATPVLIDPALMERVMVNVVKNAAESIGDRPDGRITIQIQTGGHIAVTDNGAGVAPEDAPRLFTPFFSTKRPDRGIGLMLTADILRAHRATFSLSTDPATRLTTFNLKF